MQKKKLLSVLTISALSFLGFAGTQSSGIALQTNPIANTKCASKTTTNGKFYSDYVSQADTLQAGRDLNNEIAEEGITLLKNKDGMLPLEGVKKVSVFGKNSVNPYYHGYGAGSQQSTMDPIDPYEGLELAGFETNPYLKDFYNNDVRSGSGRKQDIATGETDISAYDDSVISSLSAYHEAAIIMISRATSEGSYDPYRNFTYDQDSSKAVEDQHYLEPSVNEKALIQFVKDQGFKKIVVLINSASAFEVGSFADDDDIGGLLWISSPGNDGFKAVGEILRGTVNPSGHLVDTFYRDFTADPTYHNFGDNTQTSSDHKTAAYQYLDSETGQPLDGVQYKEFVEYEEGIYVGYKYYETVYADMLSSSGKAAADEWYNGATGVVYPFGYGLSYTDFEITSVTADVAENTDLSSIKDGKITVSVTVKNVGSVAGKEVVQLYSHAPYIDKGIEKADESLADFAKTSTLKPGQSETVSMEVYVQDLASYDYSDANKNGFKGYELDEGNYELRVRSDAHYSFDKADSVDDVLDYKIGTGNGVKYTTDRHTGATVGNLFDSKMNADGTANENDYNTLPDTTGSVGMTLMTRASDRHLVTPAAPTTAEATISKDGSLYKKIVSMSNFDVTKMSSDNVYNRTATGTEVQVDEATDNSARTHTVMFKDLMGKDKDDPAYETILNEMKYSEMISVVGHGMRKIPGVDSIGLPEAWTFDGPTCINMIDYGSEPLMASTWNLDLINQMGRMMGNEALWIGLNGLYGPGMDTHRSPFGGRNYEYFSEDGLLAGKMAAREIQGMQSKGLFVTAKHFALNEQETSRTGVATYADEQTLRELYFKPFQIAVEEGGALGVMNSFNKIGDVQSYGNYALNTQLLRDEWGFKGLIVTDTGPCGVAPFTTNAKYAVAPNMVNYWQEFLSGDSVNLGNISNEAYFGTYDASKKTVIWNDGTDDHDLKQIWLAVRSAMKDVLYTEANSSLTKNAVDISNFSGSENFLIGAGITLNKDISVDTSAAGTTNVSYKVSAGELPEGFTLSVNGILSGRTSIQGEYDFTVTLYADGWIQSSKHFHATVREPVKVVDPEGNEVTDLDVNQNFQGSLSSDFLHVDDTRVGQDNMKETRTFWVDSWNYSLLTGELPEGLELNDDGTITGAPTKAGTYEFVINITVTEHYYGGSQGNRLSSFTSMYTSNVTLVVNEKQSEESETVTPEDAKAAADEAKTTADAAKTAADAAQTAADAAKTAADAAKTAADAAQKTADEAKTAAETKKGCGGSVIASASAIAAMGLVGVALALKKKNEDK